MIGLLKLIGLMPLRAARAFGKLIGFILLSKRNRSPEVARVNLGIAYPHLSDSERDAMVRRTVYHTGMVGAEMAVLWTARADSRLKHIRNIYGGELLSQALASQRGLIALAPHTGNWELMNYYMVSQTNMVAMFKPGKNEHFSEWMRRSREQTGSTLVPTNSTGVKALLKTLKAGGTVGILPDQEPEARSGIYAPLFGRPALSLTLPHQLIARSGAQVLIMAAIRRSRGGFDVHIMKPDDDIYNPDAATAVAGMNRSIEEVVALAPDQFQWTYKRFKRNPDGPNPYKAAGVP